MVGYDAERRVVTMAWEPRLLIFSRRLELAKKYSMATARVAIAGVALVLAAGTLHAGEVPLLQPQWTATLSEQALAYDALPESGDPVALRLADGGEVSVTAAPGRIVLRRYAADGHVLDTRLEDALSQETPEVTVRAARDEGFYYVLAGGSQDAAVLMRFDTNLQRIWRASLPPASTCLVQGSCLRLALLDDDSVVAMQAYRVTRVQADGTVSWTWADAMAPSAFIRGDLAVADAAIWVASSGGGWLDATATVTRLDFGGLLLSSDVSSCHGCGAAELADIDAPGTGGVRLVGNFGNLGFYARYDALGHLLYWSAADVPEYRQVGHDGDGAVYVLAGYDDDAAVRRIDPANGATLWSVPGGDFVALDEGVVAIRKSVAGVAAIAIDANGTNRWSASLGAANGDASRARQDDDGLVSMLVRDAAASDDPCAIYPRLVHLDDSGNTTWFDRPCRTVEVPADVAGIDARADAGVLVNTSAHLAAYSPNGDPRWRVHACTWCAEFSDASLWRSAVLAVDGGAWAVRWDRPSIAMPDGSTRLQRFDANGAFAFEVASAGGSSYTGFRLLPGDGDVVALHGDSFAPLRWQRVGDDGSDTGIQDHAIPDDDYVIESARRLPGGDTLVAVKGTETCMTGVCTSTHLTLLRLAINGAEVWRYTFPEVNVTMIAVAQDAGGRTAAVLPATPSDGLRLRLIDADGHVDGDTGLTALASDERPWQLVATSDGRWLLDTEVMIDGFGQFIYRLIDANGSVQVVRSDAPYGYFQQAGPTGFLMDEFADTIHPLLLHPQTLADRALFYAGASAGASPLQMLEDGTVYGTYELPHSGNRVVARYTTPGGVPSDVLFRNGFD